MFQNKNLLTGAFTVVVDTAYTKSTFYITKASCLPYCCSGHYIHKVIEYYILYHKNKLPPLTVIVDTAYTFNLIFYRQPHILHFCFWNSSNFYFTRTFLHLHMVFTDWIKLKLTVDVPK
jgi:hypothetical protein